MLAENSAAVGAGEYEVNIRGLRVEYSAINLSLSVVLKLYTLPNYPNLFNTVTIVQYDLRGDFRQTKKMILLK